MLIFLLVATAAFLWGVWSYYHSDDQNSVSFLRAAIGLVTVVIVIVRALVS